MNQSTTAVVAPSASGLTDPGWLVGYTFLLNFGTNYTGAADNGNVDAVVRFHSSFFDVFTSLDPAFSSMVNDALALTPIDGTALSSGQIVGDPTGSGAREFNGIGLVGEDPAKLALLLGIAWADGNGGGGNNDSAAIQLDQNIQTPEVPEPGTLSLMGIGALGFAFRTWRSRRNA